LDEVEVDDDDDDDDEDPLDDDDDDPNDPLDDDKEVEVDGDPLSTVFTSSRIFSDEPKKSAPRSSRVAMAPRCFQK
jgi:hypothetical protein